MKRIILWCHIRALEANAQGQLDMLPLITDPEVHVRWTMKHVATLNEIACLQAQYRRLQRGTGLRAWRAA